MAKFSLLYNDVMALAEKAGEKADDILDDILELQTKYDNLADRFEELRGRVLNLSADLDEAISKAR